MNCGTKFPTQPPYQYMGSPDYYSMPSNMQNPIQSSVVSNVNVPLERKDFFSYYASLKVRKQNKAIKVLFIISIIITGILMILDLIVVINNIIALNQLQKDPLYDFYYSAFSQNILLTIGNIVFLSILTLFIILLVKKRSVVFMVLSITLSVFTILLLPFTIAITVLISKTEREYNCFINYNNNFYR